MERYHGYRVSNLQEWKQFYIVIPIWVIFFLQCGIIKAIGVLVPVLLDQFQTDTRTIGLAVSVSLFTGNASGMLASPLAKVFTSRSIIIACDVLSTLGLLISAVTPNVPILFIGMILTGVTCLGETLSIGMLSSYMNQYYDAAANIITTALPISIMCLAPLTQLFIDTYGWRATMLLLAAINFHYVAAAVALKPLNEDRVGQTECEHLCRSDQDGKDVSNTMNTVKAFLTEIVNVSVLKNGSFVVVLTISFIIGYGFNGWVVYLVSFVQSKGISPYEAANVATVSGVGSSIIRLVMAVLQRKTTYRQQFYFGSILVVLSYTALYLAKSYLGLSFVALILGFGYGILGTVIYIAANNTVDKEEVVNAVAWIHFVHGVGYLLNGYVTGWLKDMTGSFDVSLVQLAAASALMVVILALEDMLNKLRSKSYERL